MTHCPRCDSRLHKIWDETKCPMCGFVEYDDAEEYQYRDLSHVQYIPNARLQEAGRHVGRGRKSDPRNLERYADIERLIVEEGLTYSAAAEEKGVSLSTVKYAMDRWRRRTGQTIIDRRYTSARKRSDIERSVMDAIQVEGLSDEEIASKHRLPLELVKVFLNRQLTLPIESTEEVSL